MVTLRAWAPQDAELLHRLLGDPAMMEHLGGPEGDARIAERQARYEREDSGCYAVCDAAGDAVGWVGVWAHDTEDAPGLEMGWSVLPERQGEGLAQAGARLALDVARAQVARERRAGPAATIAAYPSVDNLPSNRICERIGLQDHGERDFEYPPGHAMRCREWRLSLDPQ